MRLLVPVFLFLFSWSIVIGIAYGAVGLLQLLSE